MKTLILCVACFIASMATHANSIFTSTHTVNEITFRVDSGSVNHEERLLQYSGDAPFITVADINVRVVGISQQQLLISIMWDAKNNVITDEFSVNLLTETTAGFDGDSFSVVGNTAYFTYANPNPIDMTYVPDSGCSLLALATCFAGVRAISRRR